MHTYTVQEAKDLLSNLVDQCTQGETILIAKEGKPLVKLVPVDHEPAQHQRLGFLAGRFTVPDDFDRMEAEG